jgi:hypothetical protein
MRHKLEVCISIKNQDNNPGKMKGHQMPDLGLRQIRRGEHPAFN